MLAMFYIRLIQNKIQDSLISQSREHCLVVSKIIKTVIISHRLIFHTFNLGMVVVTLQSYII